MKKMDLKWVTIVVLVAVVGTFVYHSKTSTIKRPGIQGKQRGILRSTLKTRHR